VSHLTDSGGASGVAALIDSSKRNGSQLTAVWDRKVLPSPHIVDPRGDPQMITNHQTAARQRTNMAVRARGAVIAVAAGLLACTATANTATARPDPDAGSAGHVGRPRIVDVSGFQVVLDADRGLYRMRGGLVGSWSILTTTTLPG
jgi:hypothetical protein